MKRLTVLASALLITTNAFAHGPSKGPHGGRQIDAGDYHVEMVVERASLVIYLNDGDDKPVDAKGHKATGLFVIEGKPLRIEFKPESANRLTGTSAVPLPATLKGAVQVTLPSGKTVQGKFN